MVMSFPVDDLANRAGVPAAHSAARGAMFLSLAILGWGLTWPINKALLDSLSPPWLAVMRSAIGTAALLAIAVPGARLVVPPREDWPVVASIALLHMVGFSLLAAIGLQYVPVGRSVVLAYTTPLWVMPAAALLLGERLTLRRLAGVAAGLLGLGLLFNPGALDWNDRASLLGHGLLLVAALCWAASIVHIRAHAWRSTPFQLVPWEALLATVILGAIALASGPWLAVQWDARLVLLLIGTSVLGVALPYWAVAMAGRNLPAIGVSLGLLGTPIVGILVANLALGEAPDALAWIALACVLGGAALGIVDERPGRRAS